MSDVAEIADRDQASGRFLKGSNGGPGRKPGSRNKLGEAFIEDLRDVWNEHGPEALRRCATEEPGQFCRIVASLMPRDLNLSVGISVEAFAQTFRSAQALLGNPEPAPRRRLPNQPVTIDGD